MKPTPPTWPLKLLRLYCDESVLEEVEGDLNELFDHRLQQRSLAYARFRYGWDVLRSVHLIVVKRKPVPHPRTLYTPMLRNYLALASRNRGITPNLRHFEAKAPQIH